MPLSRQSVEIFQETSSHATRQGTLDHGRLPMPKERNQFARANLHLKKKKKAQTGNELSTILLKSSHARKKPPGGG